MKQKFKMLLVLAALLVSAFSCTLPTVDGKIEDTTELSFETFLEENKLEKISDGYLYDGDVIFSDEEVEQLFNEHKHDDCDHAGSKGNIAINTANKRRYIWTRDQKMNIRYQFTTSMATGRLSDAQVRSAFREAAAKWNSAAGVRFVEVTSNPVFTVRIVRDSKGYSAASFFPNSSGEKSLRVNLPYVDNKFNTYEKMVGLFLHELGHSLGLAHEHQRYDSPNKHGQESYGEAFRAYNLSSVMDYGNAPFTGGISSGDRATVNYLYQHQGFTVPYGPVSSAYGYVSGGWRVNQHPRQLADVNGDGRQDIIGFSNSGVEVLLGTASGVSNKGLVLRAFGYNAGGWRVEKHPRLFADVNGDGRDDIIGFADNGVHVALGTLSGGFTYIGLKYSGFGYSAGGYRIEKHLRIMGDVNGDGRADIVGFADNGVHVALGTSSGGFTYIGRKYGGFGYSAGGWRVDKHPRYLADVNGDGRDDIVGFADNGVHVALGTSSGGFTYIGLKYGGFGYSAGGWRITKHERIMGDVNGDGRADIVGFADNGVHVALGTASGGFDYKGNVLGAFGYTAGGFRIDKHPRFVVDINGDNRDDIVGFTDQGVQIAFAYSSGRFSSEYFALGSYGYAEGGWRVDKHPRMLGDVNGDGKADIIAIGNSGTDLSFSVF